MNTLNDPCEFLEWDSSFFGRGIARYKGRELQPQDVRAAEAWCLEHRIDCLYLLAASGHAATLGLAQENGFRFVDVRVTLQRELPESTGPTPDIRPSVPDDLCRLRQIAGVSHRDSRFYADPHFPAELCDRLYELWIERSLQGWADATLVAGPAGEPAGYLSCHLNANGAGSIGLLAVGEAYRGRGYGRQLVEASLDLFRQRGMARARVVTQGCNLTSQRLYQNCGFRTHSVELWFHKWFEREPTA